MSDLTNLSGLEKLKKFREIINARRAAKGLPPKVVGADDKIFEDYLKFKNENNSNSRI